MNIVNHPGQLRPNDASSIRFDQALGDPLTDRRVEILRAIRDSGSISEAARLNHVSYKAAWQAIETLGNLAGVALIDKTVGGARGGGARLTDEGRQLLEVADLLAAARRQALNQVARLAGPGSGGTLRSAGLAGLGFRTSLRNQLACTVLALRRSSDAVRVLMRLDDGQTIAARITAESLDLLDLSVGLEVLALFKATAVKIHTGQANATSGNRLAGRVARRSTARPGAQMSLELGAGLRLAGFGNDHATLRLRTPAFATFDESAVIIARIA